MPPTAHGGAGNGISQPPPASPGTIGDYVRSAVEILGVEKFIKRNIRQFGDKLEKFHEYAEERGDGDMIFMALSLPIATGVIHVGSNRGALSKAIEWVGTLPGPDQGGKKGKREEDDNKPDPFSILSVLVLIAIVEEGRNLKLKREQKKVWQGIHQRIAKLRHEAQQLP